MKKRVFSLLLAVMMVLSLTGCGDGATKAAKLSEQYDQLLDFKVEQIECTMDGDFKLTNSDTGITNKLNFSVQFAEGSDPEDRSKQKMEFRYKIGSSKDYKPLTTFIINESETYINVQQLRDAIPELLTALGLGQYSMVIGMLPDEEYVIVEHKEVIDELEKKEPGIKDVAETSENDSIFKDLLVYVKCLASVLDDAAKESQCEVVTKKGDKTSVSVEKDTIEKLLTVLENMDVGAYYDNALKECDKNSVIAKLASENREDVVQTYKSNIEHIKKALKKYEEFDMCYSMEVSGKKGDRDFEQCFTLEEADSKEEAKITFNLLLKESEREEKITIPSNGVRLSELKK